MIDDYIFSQPIKNRSQVEIAELLLRVNGITSKINRFRELPNMNEGNLSLAVDEKDGARARAILQAHDFRVIS